MHYSNGFLLSGCFKPPFNNFKTDHPALRQAGTAIGIGAGAGAIVGSTIGNTATGAVIGGVVGASIGLAIKTTNGC